MHYRNRAIIAQGGLALLTFTLLLGAAARALQPQPSLTEQNGMSILQEPSPKPTPDPQQPDPSRRDPDGDKSSVFTGTIVKNGSDFVLRDQTGKVFRLDAPSKAEPFEGKPVKVTGKLEETARLIHVESIEEITT